MKITKIFYKSLTILTAAVLIWGNAKGSRVWAGQEDAALAEELKKKYSAGTEYDGNVIKVDRQDSLQIQLGYNPWISDVQIYDSFKLYQDAELKYEVEAGGYDYDDATGILTITPPYYGIAEIDDTSEVDLSHLEGSWRFGDEENGWGNLPQYYLETTVDVDTGEPLEIPAVTVIGVNAEITRQPQLVFDQTEEGLARFSWKEVPGAEGYLVFVIHKDETGLWNEAEVFADVSGTQWVSDQFEYEGSVLSMNERFCYYYTSDDMAAQLEAEDSFLLDYMVDGAYDELYSDYYGIVAYNSQGCSHISNLLSAKDLSHMLPHEKASYYNEGSFYDISTTKELPAVMGVTMCDGSLAQKVINYDFDSVVTDREYHSYTIMGYADQTALNWEFTVYDADLDTLDADLDQIRERQEKLKNKGGNVAPDVTIGETDHSGANTEEPETEEPEETSEEPETEAAEPDTKAAQTEAQEPGAPRGSMEIKVTANSAMSEYIALHMLETREAIDLSAFEESADTSQIVDAFFEAQYQNPLILGVQGGSIDPDNRILYVAYDFEQSVTEEKQQKVEEKVGEIISSIIREDMSDVEKEMAINAYLCEHAYYDDAALENAEQYGFAQVDEEFYDSFTAYGVLVDGVGVCASYSAAFKLLADAAGLDSIVVTGYLDGSVPHAWNKVKLEDQWYIVDATNNDNDVIGNALLNLSDAAASGTLVENEKFAMDGSLSAYAADTDELEYYHTVDKYFELDQISGQLAEMLSAEGQALLRTEYAMDDEDFSRIAQRAADLSQKDLTGFYWMGVIHLEE